jgi:hypothetical protein
VCPEVERLAVRVDEHAAERARSDLDECATVARAGGGHGKRGRAEDRADGDRQRLEKLHFGLLVFTKRSVAFPIRRP